MKTRMQPIDHVWAKLPRVVRDLSQACGKQVSVVMHGKETELDRTLLEAVKDPLTHLVRNAVDHGIETPGRTGRRGQARRGHPHPARLPRERPRHRRDRRRRRRHRRGPGGTDRRCAGGFVTAEQAARMEAARDHDAGLPAGLLHRRARSPTSPAAASAWTWSRPTSSASAAPSTWSRRSARGTTWRLTIPLTLAIIQALTVECARRALRRAAGRRARAGLRRRHGHPRSSTSPARRSTGCAASCCRWSAFDQTLGLPPVGDRPRRGTCWCSRPTGAASACSSTGCSTPRRSSSRRSPPDSRSIGVYAGATILGDGKVALILDVPSLARRSQLGIGGVDRESATRGLRQGRHREAGRLLVTSVGDRRVAIPLDSVTRLEEFAADRIEHVRRPRGRAVPRRHPAAVAPVPPARRPGRGGAATPSPRSSTPRAAAASPWSSRRSSTSSRTPVSARHDLTGDGMIGSAVVETEGDRAARRAPGDPRRGPVLLLPDVCQPGQPGAAGGGLTWQAVSTPRSRSTNSSSA